MKKTIFLAATILLLMAQSCQDNAKTADTSTPEQLTITASVESHLTRSTISYSGMFHWDTQDAIGVVGKTQNAEFHFRGDNNFFGTFNTAEKILWSYYPYAPNALISGNTLQLNRSQSAEATEQNCSPMVGRILSSGKHSFTQTGGVLHVTVRNIPEHYSTIRIESQGKDAPLISGKILIPDISQPECTYIITEGSHILEYDISNWLRSEQTHEIYIPLQVGTYPHIKVSFLDRNMQPVGADHNLTNVNVARAAIIRAPVIEGEEL